MILKRFYDDKLAQASYLVGCAATGDAIVIDPLRDVAPYLKAAEAEGVRITAVTETHIHADFVSGLREMASATGASAYLSGEGGTDWSYGYAEDIDAVLVRDGDTFSVGNIRFDVLHTPGHTPEHLTFLVTDTAGASEPIGALTGDFVFVGDVGRPDLLEKAAGVSGTMEAGARQLYASLERFRALPEWLQIWPGHGAGSACGKGLSSIPHSTLGYEKRFNWAFSAASEEAFVASVLEGQPEPPRYFAEMKRINRDGPTVLHGFPNPDLGDEEQLEALLAQDEYVVDTRPAAQFGDGFVPGTLNIPLNGSFTTWAGWLLPYDQPIHLIVDAAHRDQAIRDLVMIGLDRVAVVFPPAVVGGWADRNGELSTIAVRTPDETDASRAAGDATVLDVRGRSEWEEGHIDGVQVIPVGLLPDHLGELPRDQDLVLHCKSGGRSAIAASLLHRAGFRNVSHMEGGYMRWAAEGRSVVKESTAGPEGS